MIISRRRLLTAGSSAFVAGAIGAPFVARAQQAEFTYKYANNLPATHPMNTRAQEMAAAIKAETNGRFDIQIFPSNQLGSDTDMLSQVRSGGVEFFTLSGLILSTLVPGRLDQRRRLRLPGLRHGLEGDGRRPRRLRPRPDRQGQPRRHGQDLGQRLPPDHVLDASRSTRPTTCKGFKIRVPVSPLWTSHVQGVRRRRRPRSTSTSSTTALQTKVVDGQENPLRDHRDRQALRGAEVLLADQPHVGRLLVPRQPPRLGAPARGRPRHRGASTSTRAARERARRRRQAQRQPAAGTRPRRAWSFNQPDPAPFRDKLRKAGFYAEWKGKYGDEAWAILEKSVGKLV